MISFTSHREIEMNGSNRKYTPEILQAICRELVDLARYEENRAADQAAEVPYWRPVPPSVLGHRAAAAALRDVLTRLETELRIESLAS